MTFSERGGAAAALASYNDEAFLAYSKSKIGEVMAVEALDRLETPTCRPRPTLSTPTLAAMPMLSRQRCAPRTC